MGECEKKTLVVEDSLVQCETFLIWLEQDPLYKHQVTVARSNAAAHAAINKCDFDLVILDLNLPNGEGIDTLDRLNVKLDERAKRLPTVEAPPVIVVTHLSGSQIKVSALKARATEFRFKSQLVEPADLHEAVLCAFARQEAYLVCRPMRQTIESIKTTVQEAVHQ